MPHDHESPKQVSTGARSRPSGRAQLLGTAAGDVALSSDLHEEARGSGLGVAPAARGSAVDRERLGAVRELQRGSGARHMLKMRQQFGGGGLLSAALGRAPVRYSLVSLFAASSPRARSWRQGRDSKGYTAYPASCERRICCRCAKAQPSIATTNGGTGQRGDVTGSAARRAPQAPARPQ
jgi:hypothetical protein